MEEMEFAKSILLAPIELCRSTKARRGMSKVGGLGNDLSPLRGFGIEMLP